MRAAKMSVKRKPVKIEGGIGKPAKTVYPSTDARAAAAVPKRFRIVVADDHPLTRAGVVQLINEQPELEVCS